MPEDLWLDFKARVQAAYQAPSRAIACGVAEGLVADYESELPSAVACIWMTSRLALPLYGCRSPPPGNRHDQPPRTPVPRGALAPEDHSQRLRRKGRLEAHVRRHGPYCQALARRRDCRLPTTQMAAVKADLDQEYRASRSQPGRLEGATSTPITQQVSDLTLGYGSASEAGASHHRCGPFLTIP